MKRTRIIVLASVLGLAVLAAIPALAQEPARDPELTCPYHYSTVMPRGDMEGWMGSTQHRQMRNADHSSMHTSMSATDGMMGTGTTMGNRAMIGDGHMATGGGMMGGPFGR